MTTQLDHYVNACVPKKYTILGIKLNNFSLGHYFLMHRFECGFGADDIQLSNPPALILDLILGVAICSRTYDEFLVFMEDDKAFNQWCKQRGKEIKHAMKHDKNFNIIHKVNLFRDYMEDSVVVPMFATGKESEGKSSGSHWSLSLLQTLMSEYGYSQKEAFDMPISKAFTEYFKVLEKHGSISFLSDEDMGAIKELEALEKEGK